MSSSRSASKPSQEDNYSKIARFLRGADQRLRNRQNQIFGLSSVLALLLAILNMAFPEALQSSLPQLSVALIGVLTSNSAIFSLLILVLMVQVAMFRRVRWLGAQLDSSSRDEELEESDLDEMVTDGGRSRTQPRDSKGRFVSEESGGSGLLLLVLAAIGGYVYGSQFGQTEALIAALFGIAVMSLFSDQV